MEGSDGGKRGEKSSLLVSMFELLETDEQRSEEVSDDESDEVSANSADRPAD